MRTFTTLTQAPSAFMEPIHNRMPILLQPKPEQVWLDLDELPDHLWEASGPITLGSEEGLRGVNQSKLTPEQRSCLGSASVTSLRSSALGR